MWPFKKRTEYEIRLMHDTKRYRIYNKRGYPWQDDGNRGGYFWSIYHYHASEFDTIEEAKKAWDHSHHPLYTVVEKF